MLEVKHLTVRSKEGRPLVRDVSFTLTPGEPLGLTGASGSGKTTIIKAVMGILPYGCAIESGEILLDGQSLEGLPARKRREYCGTVLGFIPQSPMTALIIVVLPEPLAPVRPIGFPGVRVKETSCTSGRPSLERTVRCFTSSIDSPS